MEKNKTPVEWLIEKVKSKEWQDMFIWNKEEVFNEALKMEEEQSIESYCQGCLDISKDETIFPRETSEEYYNETYNKD